ncbi:hypothetical protein IWZ01DRAFT_511224 [Phyllosticta capitalensis]
MPVMDACLLAATYFPLAFPKPYLRQSICFTSVGHALLLLLLGCFLRLALSCLSVYLSRQSGSSMADGGCVVQYESNKPKERKRPGHRLRSCLLD